MNTFESYELRTTNVRAAADFYADVLGLEARPSDAGVALCSDGSPVAAIVELPEAARARGAPAHWLGQIGVASVPSALEHLQAQGAQVLGLPVRDPSAPHVLVRDPFGAIVGLRAPSVPLAQGVVASHDHLSQDSEAAFGLYSQLFGWRATERFELDPAAGPYQRFAWAAAGPSVGALISAARLSHIHAQWLYYFRVPDLERAAARVRELGSPLVNQTLTLPFGARVTQCDDAQGAAFGLWQD